MEQFKIMYKILKYLERSMNYDEFDPLPIMAEQLGVSNTMWANIMKMLVDNGYIGNVEVSVYIHSPIPYISNINIAKITLKGLEYLEENSMMKKCANVAKGLKETLPFI